MDLQLPGDSPCTAGSPPGRNLVFLLHGFGGRPVLMARVARYLRGNDFAVRHWAYRSVRQQIGHHTDRLRDELARIAAEGRYSHVDFVTHSLGGIVVRHLLSKSALTGVRRIVMLAPPNSGSHVARIGSMFLRGFCPVLRELSDRNTSFVNRLILPPHVEIGIIAGSGDWVVRQSSTHLPNERDHIVLRGGHLSLPFMKSCVEQTEHFLRHGTFNHEASPRRSGRLFRRRKSSHNEFASA
jgi:pimeloyl-ACP methyl ester carboxylesterase